MSPDGSKDLPETCLWEKIKFCCWKENIQVILKVVGFLVLTGSFATLSESLNLVYVIQCVKKIY